MDLQTSNIKLFSLLSLALHCFFWKTSLNVSVLQGQNVTLSCPLMPNSSQGVLSWYKQTPGQGPELILSYNVTNTSQVRYGTRLDQSRYAILTREGLKLRHLLQIITTLRNDTGTYYCGFSDKNHTQIFYN
ncbi:secreted immunoglobulin domain 1 [Rhinichthys klamathensis goyatoka]|uniref:secreted immunoglobulin domain 1 n=1 Tax=Rhinichthys klamathensis goyatoka TaxID=3034132 RepID=UPI0024B5AB6D|nr:secreted immunoglobulin domain 1 [Rhinichthys klamathensis goyatoka]